MDPTQVTVVSWLKSGLTLAWAFLMTVWPAHWTFESLVEALAAAPPDVWLVLAIVLIAHVWYLWPWLRQAIALAWRLFRFYATLFTVTTAVVYLRRRWSDNPSNLTKEQILFEGCIASIAVIQAIWKWWTWHSHHPPINDITSSSFRHRGSGGDQHND